MTEKEQKTIDLILNKQGNIAFEATGAYIITVAEFPYPKRPILANHDHQEERLSWARENREKHGKIITELLTEDNDET
jgi:hypothetical protein